MIVIIFLISLLLSGCSDERCIDADDFGFPKVTIPAGYDKSDITSISENYQIAPWIDSHYKVNGAPLLILVKTWEYATDWNTAQELSAWCPWYGNNGDKNKLSVICQRLSTCKFKNDNACDKSLDDAPITNAPCLMKDGMGLYALIPEPGTDPNSSFVSQMKASGITFHIGDPISGYELYDISKTGDARKAGGVLYKYGVSLLGNGRTADSELAKTYAGRPLYFKILDKFYDDNTGQYKVVIKSGVSDTRPDPLEFVEKIVRDTLFGSDGKYGIIKGMYENIITNPSYRLAVRGMLVLYIMYSAMAYLTGNINITNNELVTRLFKVIIVSVLLSSKYAWNFFNDYLFVYFVGGVDQVIHIIKDAANSGPGTSSLIGLMIAPETIAKITSLLLVDWRGFIYIILYFIALAFVFTTMFHAMVLYLTALMAIGIIIAMAPIFLCFILFDITRSLFENWLKQLIGYALQPIILFSGIAFISILIRSEIYSTLGFRVCNKEFPDLGSVGDILGDISSELNIGVDLTHSIFYWGVPNPFDRNFTRAKANIPVPIDKYENGILKCKAYECIEERYIEFPFVDPNDTERINEFFSGHFLHFSGLLLIFACLYLLNKFNDFSVSISQFLSNTSGNLFNTSSAAEASSKGIQKGAKIAMKKVKKGVSKVASRVNKSLGITAKIHELDKKYKISEKYEGLKDSIDEKFNTLAKKVGGDPAKEALDPKKAKASVLAEVKKMHGLDYSKLNPEALKLLKDKKIDLSKSFDKSKDKLAKDKFGKSFDKLNLREKKELRKLYSDAESAADFQKKYVQAYQDMSERGLGLFGKNIKAFRNFKEMKNRYNAYKGMKADKALSNVEKLYSGYAGIKRGILKKVLGEDVLAELDKIDPELSGAVWHGYDPDDPRLRTYSEQLKDKEKKRKNKNFEEYLRNERKKSNSDIFDYEHQIAAEKLGKNDHKGMLRLKAEKEVYERFTSGDNPVLMGDKFMREKATDTQMRDMIDRAHKIRSEMLREDPKLKQEDHHKFTHDVAVEKIKGCQDEIKKYLGRDCDKENMHELLAEARKVKLQDYARQIDGHNKAIEERCKELAQQYNHTIDPRAMNQEKISELLKQKDLPKAARANLDILSRAVNERAGLQEELSSMDLRRDHSELTEAFGDFEHSQEVLRKIDEHKKMIDSEVGKHVGKINDYRRMAGMAHYEGRDKPEPIKIRSIKTVDELLKNS